MEYNLLEIFLVAACSIIVILVIVLITRKRNVIVKTKYIETPVKYYTMQSVLDEYERQSESIKKSVDKIKQEWIEIKRQDEELIYANSLIEKQRNIRKYSEKIPIASQNLSLLEKCDISILKTNDIDVLYLQYTAGLEFIRWFLSEETLYPDAPYLLSGGAENYLINFKEQYNEMIFRVAGYHLVKYKHKFHELYTVNARQTHTQKMFIKLDQLNQMVVMDAKNGDLIMENLNDYHSQVEDLFSHI
ncbi:MAG: hypothetical protein LBI60_06175 [Bacteroidales bacterium]|jgi:hypothetical protein|nr:hypothetical protein [Bacteroidales bacterium]